MSEIVTPSTSSTTRRNTHVSSWAVMRPTTAPPTTFRTKSPEAESRSNDPPTAAATAVRYATSAVPSLMRLSPSMRVMSRRGTPSRWVIEIAASGSVGDTIAPNANAAAHGTSGTAQWIAAATAHIVSSTRTTALSVIARALWRRSRTDAKYAALKSSGGRNSSRTRSGSSSTCGTPGAKPMRLPPTTSRIGYGTPMRLARPVSRATLTSRNRRMSSTCSTVRRAT